jgi:hypothetical protein
MQMKTLNKIIAILAFTSLPAYARTVEVENELDSPVSFVVTQDASNVTAFSQSGSVDANSTTTIEVPDDVNSCKYILTRGNETTGWVHAFFMGTSPDERLVFNGGYTWSTNG